MSTIPLNYTITPPRQARKWFIRAAYCATAIAILVAASSIQLNTSRYMDPITGSARERTTCNFGIEISTKIEPSPLAIRLKKIGAEPPATWQYYGDTTTGLFTKIRACGTPPPIFNLRPVMQNFVDNSTDSEIHQFVQIMQSGTPAAQSTAIDFATEAAFATSAKR
jgi:hypothetical protein